MAITVHTKHSTDCLVANKLFEEDPRVSFILAMTIDEYIKIFYSGNRDEWLRNDIRGWLEEESIEYIFWGKKRAASLWYIGIAMSDDDFMKFRLTWL